MQHPLAEPLVSNLQVSSSSSDVTLLTMNLGERTRQSPPPRPPCFMVLFSVPQLGSHLSSETSRRLATD